MANFNTHFNVAAVTTGLAAATLLSAEHINLNTALGLWFLGTLGGLLPDVDSDNSTSLDIIFNLFAFSAVLMVLRYLSESLITENVNNIMEVSRTISMTSVTGADKMSLSELIILPLIVYGIMRYLVRPIFEKITVHRGSCHSIAFVLLIALITMQIVWRVSPQNPEGTHIVAWLSGGFVFLGGIIHLTLDELYSVDLSNVRVKRSFGTALKLAEFKNKGVTLLTALLIVALSYTAPSPNLIINTLSDWSALKLTPYQTDVVATEQQ